MSEKLKGKRRNQLIQLYAASAFSRDTACAVALADHRYSFSPPTLSRMIGEGLVENAYMPVNGDTRRRASHYWLTDAGLKALGVSIMRGPSK